METGNLRNEDFRKLLTQKRTEPAKKDGEHAEKKSSGGGAAFSHKQAAKNLSAKKKGGHGHKHKKEKPKRESDVEDEEEGDAKLKEILKNYRDRAAERRGKGDEPLLDPQLAAGYRAVPGDRRAVYDAAHKRQQAIEESKYLGGDMEHTHLVKGLDYSLLHKVRSEMTKPGEGGDDDDELEAALVTKNTVRGLVADDEDAKQPDSLLARNINRILFKNELPLRNELFGKGRMAYVVELDEEASDVPTTLLRSVHDCPATDSNAAVNANNVLISKLTQVLAYLRTDTKKKQKLKEVFATEEDRAKAANSSIYDDDYAAPKRDKEDRGRERERERDEKPVKRDYFGDGNKRDDRDYRDSRGGDRDRDRRDDRHHRRGDDREERRKAEEREREEKARAEAAKRLEEKLAKRKRDTEGYDECYPMGFGAGYDSDEEDEPEAKKGRAAWGEEEDQKAHKSNRATEVKAAYQFGVKKGDGRKTGKGQDKKLDQELHKINKIMEKRKGEGGDAPRMKY